MVMMTVRSSVAAERRNSPIAERNHARRKSYVALLSVGARNSIERRFIERHKDGNSIRFNVSPASGDIYEIRRWCWDGDRQNFIGGTEYIGFDEVRRPFVLTRDEAFTSVLHARLTTDAERQRTPTHIRPERVLPSDILFS